MELKIKQVQFPEAITFNYEEIKVELAQKMSYYKGIVYTEDQVKEAKKDMANLRKFTKALSDARIQQKKLCLKPYEDFEAKVKELTAIVDEPIALIDSQVKSYDDKQKEDKLQAIKEYWNSKEVPEGIALEEVFEPRWLNASVSLKSIQDNIDASLDKIKQDISTIRNLPEYSFEALDCYNHTLDLAAAFNEAHRLSEQAKAKAAWEAKKTIQPDCTNEEVEKSFIEDVEAVKDELPEQPETDRQWIGFQALLSVEEAKALGAWMKANNIKYKAI